MFRAWFGAAIIFGLWVNIGTAIANDAANLSYLKTKPYDQWTPAEITAAKEAAKKRDIKTIVFCADPGNLPLSDKNRDGYQNKIAEIVAAHIGAKARFFWRPYLERGLTRLTFENNECEVLIEQPSDSNEVLTTAPIYRTTYVLAWRKDKDIEIKNLDDPILEKLKIGVFQHSALRRALARRGIKESVDIHVISAQGDLRPELQPWRQVQRVVDGELDVSGVWGPFAGWVKTKRKAPLEILPVNLMEDVIPLEFSLSMGIQKEDVVLKFTLDNALEAREAEITKLLNDYGVPLVECSKCIVNGKIPSHGAYDRPAHAAYQKRFLETKVARKLPISAADHQRVTTEKLEAWLAEGVDINQELGNAVLAGDAERVTFLIGKGADVNAPDNQGFRPLHTAAKTRHADMIDLLAKHGADPNLRDNNNESPLLYAIMRNHVPSIKALKKSGVDVEALTDGGFSPLLMAITEGSAFAASTLLDEGANPTHRSGPHGITPLMATATQQVQQKRVTHLAKGPTPLELAERLIQSGADVNASTDAGVTALMIAAGHNNMPMIAFLLRSGADPDRKSKAGKTALDIARDANHVQAERALRRLMKKSAASGDG